MAVSLIFHVLLLLSLFFQSSTSSSSHNTCFSLSVEKPEDVILSQNGVFSAGFYVVGENAYVFAVWFTKNPTAVWMANRDQPVNGKRSSLSILRTGNLVLSDAGQYKVWSTDTTSSLPIQLNLTDKGNLVLYELHPQQSKILWQSFDFPTDTLLPGQQLTRYTKLVSFCTTALTSPAYIGHPRGLRAGMLEEGHEECLEWIVHCDIKPQNILLDSNYQPKVADFGLSKLQNRNGQNSQNFSMIRGTRGYMAPEWVFNLPITSKVDVYSYGIVVLEMITGRSPVTMGIQSDLGEETQNGRLVTWVREKRKKTTSEEGSSSSSWCWVEQIIDPIIVSEYEVEKRKMETLAKVALECVEEDKDARPTMSQVVEMLQCHENDAP